MNEKEHDDGAALPVDQSGQSTTEALPNKENHELAVQLILRYARGGNEHQLAKARALLGLSWEWEPNHRCQFCPEPDREIPLSRHWGDVAGNQVGSGTQASHAERADPTRRSATPT